MSEIRRPEPAGVYPPPQWEQRFRAGEVLLPEWAAREPSHAVLVASASGALQVHSYNATTGQLVRATNRPAGTTRATIDPTGQWIWWFDDTDGDERGIWRRQPFGSTAQRRPERAIELSPAHDAGLLLAADGTAIVGRSDPRFGTQIHQLLVGAAGYGATAPVLVYGHPQPARAAALSFDGNLVAIEHSEHGDALHPAIKIARADSGAVLAGLYDGPGLGLWPQAFAPVDGDVRLLVRHERGGHRALVIWDGQRGLQRPIDLGLPGDVLDAAWAADARSLLVRVDHQARTLLYRYHLSDGTVRPVGPTVGTVTAATPRPRDDAWARRSSAASPPAVMVASTDRELLHVGTRAPSSVPVRDIWAQGSAGPVHALLRVPAGQGPHPVIVRAHGGPHGRDADVFDAESAAWVDHGFAVLNVNYRGSTGYGSAWRESVTEDVGFGELSDIEAVHAQLVRDGVVDPDRSILSGKGWGGYLTLLGLGVQSQRWALGIALAPVADTVGAYAAETATLQAQDRALHGGTPAEEPESYRRASPLSYVDQVRVPVLIFGSRNDARGPIGQIEEYVRALDQAGGDVEAVYSEGGHVTLVDADRISRMRLQLSFAHRHLSEA